MSNTIFDIPLLSWSDLSFERWIMTHDLGQPEDSSTSLIRLDDLWSNRLDITNGYIYDIFSVKSIDWNDRWLYNNDGFISLDWNNEFLVSSQYTNQVSVDWYQRHLYTCNYQKTLDWQNGYAYVYYDESLSIAWSDRILSDGTYMSLRWDSRLLYDASQETSLDWNNRELFDSSQNQSIDWNGRLLYNAAGNNTVDYDAANLLDTNAFVSVDWQNRQLLKSDGTVALDWSTNKVKTCLTTLVQLTQTGSGIPVITTTPVNELGVGLTLARTGTGSYIITFASGLDQSKLAVFVTPTSGIINCIISDTQITISTYTVSGVQSDELLNNTPFKIEYYIL